MALPRRNCIGRMLWSKSRLGDAVRVLRVQVPDRFRSMTPAPRRSGSPVACVCLNSSVTRPRRDRPWRTVRPALSQRRLGSTYGAPYHHSRCTPVDTPTWTAPIVSLTNVPPPPVTDKLLLIDGPRYGGSTIVASLEDGLAYPNPNQDFDNSTTRRQDRGTRAPLAGDHRIGSPSCSATRWAYRMGDASDANTTCIRT